MAQQHPDWTVSPTEWAILRDQLTSSSHPSLSTSTQLSSYVLIALCSLSFILHSASICLRCRKITLSSTRLPFGSLSLGYHQPNLSFILPFIFCLNALLNIVSISSLLSDANRLIFKGHTLAIQHINFSFLLSAGVLTTWALACGLPPIPIGICGPLRDGVRRSNDTSIHPGKTIRPSRFNLIGYSSILMVLLIPLPCTILSKKATDDMNTLDDTLLIKINQILENVDQPANELINQALNLINKLDRTSNFLFFHFRILSALHLFFTLSILFVSALISVHIFRSKVPKVHVQNSKKFNHLYQFSQNLQDPIDNHPIDNSIIEPKPALINDLTRSLLHTSSPEHKLESDQYGPQDPSSNSNNHINQNQNNRNSFFSFTSDIHCLPSNDIPVNKDHSIQLKKYIKKVKCFFGLLSISCLCFSVLNFCIVCNLFKYPDEISIGDLSILKLEWSTWLWNGSISPFIGFINCFILMRKTRTQNKFSIPFTIF